jgi:hypothetical protein
MASVICSGTVVSFGSQAGQRRGIPQPPPYFEAILGLYINQLQQFMELTDDQYLKLAALLKDYLRARYELDGPSRNRAISQLKQAVNRGATDDELTAAMQEFDRIDGDLVTTRQTFLAKADPMLQLRQRAKLRVYIVNKDNQVHNLIQASQNPGAVPKPAAPNPPANKP